MTNFQKKISSITSFIAAIGFLIWFCLDPSFEPAIGFVLILGAILSSWKFGSKYKENRLKGNILFDYSNNNGVYKIGVDQLIFETQWSKASNHSIHSYNDPPSISGVAIASNKYQISDIEDASEFDFSSRSRTVKEHEIIIVKNIYGNYAAIKILEIKDSTRGDDRDELRYEYVINPNNKTDFS